MNSDSTARIDWTPVASFDVVHTAELARLPLEAEGISTTLENAELVAMAWHYGNAVGHVKLLAPRADAARARDILKSNGPRGEHACLACGDPLPASYECPRCGWRCGDPTDWTADASASPLLSERLRDARRIWIGYCEAYPTAIGLALWALVVVVVVGGVLLSQPLVGLVVAAACSVAFLVAKWILDLVAPREDRAMPVCTWAIGDRVLVRDDAETSWLGTIAAVDMETVDVLAEDDGKLYRDVPRTDVSSPGDV